MKKYVFGIMAALFMVGGAYALTRSRSLEVRGAAQSGEGPPAFGVRPAARSARDLGELIVLEGLFAAKPEAQTKDVSRLERLIVLDRIFSNPDRAAARPRNVSRLGELIVLEGLFGERNQSPRSRLEELIVLDGLFSEERR